MPVFGSKDALIFSGVNEGVIGTMGRSSLWQVSGSVCTEGDRKTGGAIGIGGVGGMAGIGGGIICIWGYAGIIYCGGGGGIESEADCSADRGK